MQAESTKRAALVELIDIALDAVAFAFQETLPGRMLDRQRHHPAGDMQRVARLVVAQHMPPSTRHTGHTGVLGMLALEFKWAENLMEKILDRLEAAKQSAANASPLQRALGIAATALGIAAFAAAAILWDIPLLPVL